jgi:hypothetical protein
MNFRILFIAPAVFLFSFFGTNATAQDERGVWSIKFGYSRINNCPFRYGNGEISAEGNYRMNRLAEAGIYAGYTKCWSERKIFSNGRHTETDGATSQALSCGVNIPLRRHVKE